MHNTKQREELFDEIMRGAGVSGEFKQWLLEKGFFTAPASIKYHGAYEGGLFDHSYEVTKELILLTEGVPLKWENPRSPQIIGMFHDLCKMPYYIKITDGENTRFTTNKEPNPLSHGDSSIALLLEWMDLTEEEILCIRHHMGAYERENWELYDMAIKQYQNVLWTHTADMYASKVLNT